MDDYETINVYSTAPPAHIAVGRLRAEGIDARLLDENVIRTLPLGGIKLQVAKRHAPRARQILETDYSEELNSQNEE